MKNFPLTKRVRTSICPKELDKLQRDRYMDNNWLSGSMGRNKPSLSEAPSKVLAKARIIIK